MKLNKAVTYPSLEGMSIYGSISMPLPVPSGLVGRAGSEVSTGHGFFGGMPGLLPWHTWTRAGDAGGGDWWRLGFFQGVLVTSALVGVDGDKWAMAEFWCKPRLLPGHAGDRDVDEGYGQHWRVWSHNMT